MSDNTKALDRFGAALEKAIPGGNTYRQEGKRDNDVIGRDAPSPGTTRGLESAEVEDASLAYGPWHLCVTFTGLTEDEVVALIEKASEIAPERMTLEESVRAHREGKL